jgi:uncharacterized protein Yka (UPF0111/DUF47 family)
VKGHRWFLPETPDVVGLLLHQLAVTIEGMDAFADWTRGNGSAAETVRGLEHKADDAKREVQRALRESFVTPLEPEDLFALSRGVDRIINESKDTVRESEVMACPPDRFMADMAALLAQGVRLLPHAIGQLEPREGDATVAAEAAIKTQRQLERVYRTAMGALLNNDDLRDVTARRELYRRCSRISGAVVDVAERIEYAVVKET